MVSHYRLLISLIDWFVPIDDLMYGGVHVEMVVQLLGLLFTEMLLRLLPFTILSLPTILHGNFIICGYGSNYDFMVKDVILRLYFGFEGYFIMNLWSIVDFTVNQIWGTTWPIDLPINERSLCNSKIDLTIKLVLPCMMKHYFIFVKATY